MGPEPLDPSVAPGAHIWGWMTPIELQWLHDTAQRMDSVCEIGSLRGRSAYALLSGCPGPVYCIDPWDDEYRQSYPAFMEANGHFPNVRPVPGLSHEVADQIPDVDMVFIDGNHDEWQVRRDLELYVPKTRKLICGHDYSLLPEGQAGYPDVRKVVDDVFGDRVRPADWLDTHDHGGFDRYSIWAVDVSSDR